MDSAFDIGLRSKQISQKSLAQVCRSLSTMLDSGIDVQKAFQLTGNKVPDAKARAGLEAVQQAIHRRGEIAEAMREQDDRFPNLMIDLVAVGEQTGSLPDVFKSLARHYETNVRLKRDFLSSIAWPGFQMIAAILVVAILIWVLGFIQKSNTEGGISVLGLTGAGGALTWLLLTFGTLAAGFIGFKVAKRTLVGQRYLDPFLMKAPVLGKCLRSFAIARFSWAFALTQQAGMSIRPSVDASMKATDNGAFIEATGLVWDRLKSGEELGDSLDATHLFPEDYIHTVRVAETSGTVPEALDRLSPHFEDEARRSLKALTAAMGWCIWVLVAIFIVVIIFNIFSQYIGALNNAAKGF